MEDSLELNHKMNAVLGKFKFRNSFHHSCLRILNFLRDYAQSSLKHWRQSCIFLTVARGIRRFSARNKWYGVISYTFSSIAPVTTPSQPFNLSSGCLPTSRKTGWGWFPFNPETWIWDHGGFARSSHSSLILLSSKGPIVSENSLQYCKRLLPLSHESYFTL